VAFKIKNYKKIVRWYAGMFDVKKRVGLHFGDILANSSGRPFKKSRLSGIILFVKYVGSIINIGIDYLG
jgi:hypothetical protein